jgi:hypothetical protein
MRKLLLFILIPFFIYAQSAPSDSTGHIKLYQWSQGANPGATGLNNNWKKIDTAVSRGVWYPEWSGAVGDGTTDDAAAFGRAIDSARGKTLILTKPVYKIASKIEKDLADSSLTIISYSNSILYLTNIISLESLVTPEGNLKLYNGGNVTITGITFRGVRDTSGTYFIPLLVHEDGNTTLGNLLIQDCRSATLNRVTSIEGAYFGVRMVDVGRVHITDCAIDSNTYAGVYINRAAQIYATGNSFSYNGTTTDAYGYGITASHRYGGTTDNQSVYIAGNRCVYNTRKAIDTHGSVGTRIVNNYCMGAIGALNEEGQDPDEVDPANQWSKRVTDIYVSGNYCFLDSAWFESITHTAPFQYLTIGSFGNTVSFGGGSITVTDNQFMDCDVSDSRALIWVAINTDGEPLKAVSIKNNTIWDVKVDTTTYGFPAEYDGVITLVNGTVVPKIVDISGNNISGYSINGIKVACYNTGQTQPHITSIKDNNFYGAFTYPLFADRDLNQIFSNNTYNGELLPDMIDAFNGSLKSSLETGASSATKDLLTIDASRYEDGMISYDIKIVVTEAVGNFRGVYEFLAVAQNDATVTSFSSTATKAKGINGDPQTYAPSVSWVGSGDSRILRATCSQTFTNCQIFVNISGWRLQTWKTE